MRLVKAGIQAVQEERIFGQERSTNENNRQAGNADGFYSLLLFSWSRESGALLFLATVFLLFRFSCFVLWTKVYHEISSFQEDFS